MAALEFALEMPRSCTEGSKTRIKWHVLHEKPLPWRLERLDHLWLDKEPSKGSTAFHG